MVVLPRITSASYARLDLSRQATAKLRGSARQRRAPGRRQRCPGRSAGSWRNRKGQTVSARVQNLLLPRPRDTAGPLQAPAAPSLSALRLPVTLLRMSDIVLGASGLRVCRKLRVTKPRSCSGLEGPGNVTLGGRLLRSTACAPETPISKRRAVHLAPPAPYTPTYLLRACPAWLRSRDTHSLPSFVALAQH